MRLQAASVVLMDSTVLHHFCRSGMTHHLESYLGDRAHVTEIVDREIRRLQDEKGGLEEAVEFLDRVERESRFLYLTDDEADYADRIIGSPRAQRLELQRKYGDHADKDLGEASTVAVAWRWDDAVVLVMDDSDGCKWARYDDIPFVKTFAAAVEIHAAGLMSKADCNDVFKRTADKAYWPEFDQQFEDRLAQLS